MKQVLILVFLLGGIITGLSAQTGDGGGIQIMSVVVHDAFNYSHKPESIIARTDTSLHFRYYILSDDEKHSVKETYQPEDPSWYRFAKQDDGPHIYIPWYKWEGDGRRRDILNQRLQLLYKGDTMTVDLIDIPGFNPNGFTDVMEKLEFYPHAHIRLYRGISARHPGLRGTENRPALLKLQCLMQKGFYDSTCRLLQEAGMAEDRTAYQQVVVLKNGAPDTTEQKDYPVYPLKPDDIALSLPVSPPARAAIRLSTAEPPMVTDTGLQYRFVFSFFFPQRGRDMSNRTVTEEEQQAAARLQAFTKDDLFINSQPFSGTVMMYYNSSWDTVSAGGGTYDLIISTYRNGRLISAHTIYDVGFLNSGREMVRPV